MNNFKDILRKERINKGLNSKELANKLGMSPQRYNNYELGKREPDIDVLIGIADILDMPIDLLVGRYTKSSDNQYQSL